MTDDKLTTWAHLKPETPFNHLFPDGRVPIRSFLPIIPREHGAPRCYLVPGKLLTDEQIRGLAELIWRSWQPECGSVEQAINYIRDDALPLQENWFTGVSIADQRVIASLLDDSLLDDEGGDDDSDWIDDDPIIAWIDGEAVYRGDEP